MKKLYRIMWDNSKHTRNKRDKTRKVKVWIKKTQVNSGKLFRKLVIIYWV